MTTRASTVGRRSRRRPSVAAVIGPRPGAGAGRVGPGSRYDRRRRRQPDDSRPERGERAHGRRTSRSPAEAGRCRARAQRDGHAGVHADALGRPPGPEDRQEGRVAGEPRHARGVPRRPRGRGTAAGRRSPIPPPADPDHRVEPHLVDPAGCDPGRSRARPRTSATRIQSVPTRTIRPRTTQPSAVADHDHLARTDAPQHLREVAARVGGRQDLACVVDLLAAFLGLRDRP